MDHAISIYDFPEQIDHAKARLAAVRKIHSAKSKTGMAKKIADPAVDGWSWQNLHKLYKRWIASGQNNIVLLDRRFHKSLQRQSEDAIPDAIPDEFLQWVGGKMLANKRKSKPARRRIIEAWETWRDTGHRESDAFPGYDQCPPDSGKGHPHGWSYRNLMEYAQPPIEQLLIARQGTVAAKSVLPFVPGTREGVRFLEYIFCDDVWWDRVCMIPGYLDPCRILQLGCLDYASGVYLNFGVRPFLPREDGTRESLKRRDFLFLVSSILLEYGWPKDYTMHFVVERATATMSLAEARFLYDLSDGQIQVGYTNMEGQFVLAWDEAKSGNPQGKGPLESWHNLFHNECADLEGQVGKDRDHSPASLKYSNREAVAVGKAALLLDQKDRPRLQSPYPTLTQGHRQTIEIVRRINTRRDHQMEGFDKITLWSIPSLQTPWRTEAELATVDPAVSHLVKFRAVNENPIERLQRLSADIRVQRPHPGAMVRFYEDSHTNTKIQNLRGKAKVEGKTLWFGPDDPIDALPNGTEICLHHAPIDPAYALVTSGGQFIGVWKKKISPRGDADALAEGIKEKQTFLNHAVSQVRGKMLDKLVEQDRRLTENIEVLEDGGVLPTASEFSRAKTVQAPGSDIAEGMQRATEVINRETNAVKSRAKSTRDLDPAVFLDDDTEENIDRAVGHSAGLSPEDLL